jgi:hypothetical protein
MSRGGPGSPDRVNDGMGVVAEARVVPFEAIAAELSRPVPAG